MSVSALDRLLLSIAADKRDGSRLDVVPFSHRFFFQHRQRKRLHHQSSNAQHKQPAFALRFYGLKKNGLPRTLLAAFQVETAELPKIVHPPRSLRFADAGLFTESNVRLFFEGLLLQKDTTSVTRLRLPWLQQAKPMKLLGRNSMLVDTKDYQPRRVTYYPSIGLPVDEQIERVRSRRRNSKSVLRRSPSSSTRRGSSFEPRLKISEIPEEKLAESTAPPSTGKLDRVEAAIDAAASSAMRVVAAEANAQLSFELIERKANNNNTHYVATTGAGPWDNDSVEWQTCYSHSVDNEQLSATEMKSHASLQEEVEALRAENAEQKALIRQLLIENRRLLAHQQQPPRILREEVVPSPTSKRKQSSESRRSSQTERDRGVSTVSTSTSSTASLARRASLTFDMVDGRETLVDHKFDHLVSEITTELAELLSEDGMFSSHDS